MTIPAVRVVFEGRVQGVGFRYTTLQLAKQYQIRGWVRNAFDGSVEMVAAASPDHADALDEFMRALQNRMSQYIQRTHQSPTVLSPEISSFEIRH